MTELRWVLLALGVLLIGGVYLWGRGLPARWAEAIRSRREAQSRVEPRVEPEADIQDPFTEVADDEGLPDSPAISASPHKPTGDPGPVESVITLRFVPHQKELPGDRVILALRAAGLKHGRYGIFHRHPNESSDDTLFSVANLTEPGSFDLTRLTETRIRGMSFFMVLPGEGDPIERFDLMVATAREIARSLDGELRDEEGSSWSIQRERYVREEIIEYLHSMDRQWSR